MVRARIGRYARSFDEPDILDAPLETFIDARRKPLVKEMGLDTVDDLLHHFPLRYVHVAENTDIASLKVGEAVTAVVEVERVSTHPMRDRRQLRTEVVTTDGRERLLLTFFHRSSRLSQLRAGMRLVCAGTVQMFHRQRQLAHPEFVVLDAADARFADYAYWYGAHPSGARSSGADADPAADDVANSVAERWMQAPMPIYSVKGKINNWEVHDKVRELLREIPVIPDPVPRDVLREQRLPSLQEALRAIHVPLVDRDWQRARVRFRWDEAFLVQVALAVRRSEIRKLAATPRRAHAGGLVERFEERLPFTFTAGQLRVGRVLDEELARPYPMQRLLQGEVGSGKTVVALRAMLTVVDAGGQAALLAPTEVLAAQHYQTVTDLLGPLAAGGMLGGSDGATRVALLTGSQATKARRAALLDAQSGAAGIVIGTHALLEERVGFADLGLVVIDEQHRFGVEQRDALQTKAAHPPHVLVMTATPIPRTVAMTVFGDLETSTLEELPTGRAGVGTHVVPVTDKPHFLHRVWERVREEVDKGGQAFVLCPRIGTDDDLAALSAGFTYALGEVAAAPGIDDPDALDEGADLEGGALDEDAATGTALIAEHAGLRAGPLAGLRVEMLHGRLPPADKTEVMRRFSAGEIDVLVSTTVVEVGVDVPNATTMVVLDADRFGVSQLHQLRGRVGRGPKRAVCLLVTRTGEGSPARQRLDAVAATTDGFELARVDLQQRREGDVMGASQSGRRSSLRFLRVIEHEETIAAARLAAERTLESDPSLDRHPLLRDKANALLAAERGHFLARN